MSLSISKVRPATAQEWDAAWQACDYATYFHSREWAEILEAYTFGKIRPAPRLVVFSDGQEAVWPLSVNRRYKGLIREYQSSPGGTFGGWISAGSLSIEHGRLLAEHVLKQCSNLVWRLNPYDSLVEQLDVVPSNEDETHVIDLSPGFDAILRRWTKGHSSAVKKAVREGVEVRLASSLEDWQEYFRVYQSSLARWGEKATSQYSWKLFESLAAQHSSHVRLWLSTYDGRVIAGALCFYAKSHVVYWHGAALEDFFVYRPVNLLIYEIVKVACLSGYSWFDFNPSGGHEGVKSFKKSFGAESISSGVYYKQSNLLKYIVKIKQFRH